MKVRVENALLALALLAVSEPAHSHGIAGNRYFDGTLTFDDPAVADGFLSAGHAGRTVRANVTFDAGLLEAIDAEAERRGLTRSAFLASAAREKIEARH